MTRSPARSALIIVAVMTLGSCARAQTSASAEMAPAPEQLTRITPHGAWTFTIEAGGQRMPGSMIIARDAGQSRITVRDLNLINEVVESETLELGESGAFVWTGSVAGNTFVMSGRVEGDELTAQAEAPGMGPMTLRGRREADAR